MNTADRVQSWVIVGQSPNELRRKAHCIMRSRLKRGDGLLLARRFPLTVDAIPGENGFVPNGIVLKSLTIDIIINIPDQQTFNPSRTQAGSWDSTGVPMQPGNFEPLQDTGSYPTELPGDACSTAYDLGATGFAYDQGVPVSTYPTTVDPESYGYVELSQSVLVLLF
ncbi:hypothetical protein CI238_13258 [Colletotrichum incanum]|uniref:Uncharacterized protein n=1 Tax=Colletotrichum incanum TaxID=1573173 RepID=A0A166UZC4_COLIC|nr:hypothetical protein CI238_13258 [Colletotrichum incanum]